MSKVWIFWILLVVLVAGLAYTCSMVSEEPTEPERVAIDKAAPNSSMGLDEATLQPGRVVELDTAKGKIEFVLFEKDCPLTTKRIADLVGRGVYNKMPFSRVLNKEGLIQTAVYKGNIKPVKREMAKGLTNEKGSVGLARNNDPDSGTSSFYILSEPWHHLDYEYCVFGRVIAGMDVVMKIQKNDIIRNATIRRSTPQDKTMLMKMLGIEAERKTQ